MRLEGVAKPKAVQNGSVLETITSDPSDLSIQNLQDIKMDLGPLKHSERQYVCNIKALFRRVG